MYDKMNLEDFIGSSVNTQIMASTAILLVFSISLYIRRFCSLSSKPITSILDSDSCDIHELKKQVVGIHHGLPTQNSATLASIEHNTIDASTSWTGLLTNWMALTPYPIHPHQNCQLHRSLSAKKIRQRSPSGNLHHQHMFHPYHLASSSGFVSFLQFQYISISLLV